MSQLQFTAEFYESIHREHEALFCLADVFVQLVAARAKAGPAPSRIEYEKMPFIEQAIQAGREEFEAVDLTAMAIALQHGFASIEKIAGPDAAWKAYEPFIKLCCAEGDDAKKKRLLEIYNSVRWRERKPHSSVGRSK